MPNYHEALRPRSERKKAELKNRKHHAGNRRPDFDPGRRQALKALGWGALGLAAAAGVIGTGIKLFLDSNATNDSLPKSEFSGEIDEAKFYLQKLDSEVQEDSNKLKEYLPQIANLAVAYFSRQMRDMFPERRSDYDKKRFQNKFTFLDITLGLDNFRAVFL